MVSTTSSSSTSSVKKSPKKASTLTVHKYGSKFISDILSNIIKTKLMTVKKNPQTTEKWLQKMRLSVLRKVSASSRILFQSPAVNDGVILDKIHRLKQQIQEREDRITSSAIALIKSNKFGEIMPQIGDSTSKPALDASSFEAHSLRIGDMLNQISKNVDNEMSQRIKNIESIIQVVESHNNSESKLVSELTSVQSRNEQPFRDDGYLESSTISMRSRKAPSNRIGAHLNRY